MAPVGPPLDEEKRTLRRLLAERRAALPHGARLRASQAACARLAALPEFGRASVIAGFVALRGEIDPAEALAAARGRGSVLVYPRVSADRPRLKFHALSGADTLRPGAFGVLEPPATAPEIPLDELDLLVVPGLAFDPAGRRLGYGGGYYDEVAAQVRRAGRALLVAFGYDFQIVDACPAGEGDVPVDCVVTDLRVVRCGASARDTT
jgi:5-formyltetrahydrofolate cyclo-ligase